MKKYIVSGLGFGDEGKGSIVDLLCRQTDADLVIRHNGGAQAAHNVVTPKGIHHTFSQLGSGSFLSTTLTLLSEHMMVNPVSFLNEWDTFAPKGPSLEGRVLVDARAPITTPYHVFLNRAREDARGVAKHGTTGMGISETALDVAARGSQAMIAADLNDARVGLLSNLMRVRDALMPEMRRLGATEVFERIDVESVVDDFLEFGEHVMVLEPKDVHSLMRHATGIVFEGAQGIMLDENYGFHPHTTWSTTTAKNALDMLHQAEMGGDPDDIVRLGLTRTYGTRHGAGPFPAEDFGMKFPEPHNGDEGMAGQFRRGWLDINMLKYAIECNQGIDALVVNHTDCKVERYCSTKTPCINFMTPTSLRHQEALCRRAWSPIPEDCLEATCDNFAVRIAHELRTPLAIVGRGPTARDKEMLMRL